MDLDLKVYIPQHKFERVLRISTPLITLNQLENQIRDRIPDLPQKLTYHQHNDPNTTCLEIGRSLNFYGYGNFSQETKALYIFYDEYVNEIKSTTSSVQKDNFEVKSSVSKPKKKITNAKKSSKPDDVLITILDPYLATNHTFLVNPVIKITKKEKLGLSSFLASDPYHGNHSIMDICNTENEATLYLKHIENKSRQNKRAHSNNESSDESINLEIIEKKVKKEGQAIQKEKTQKNTFTSKTKTKSLNSDQIEIEEVLTSGDETSMKSTPTQMLSKITKNFDTLLTLQKVNSKLLNKEKNSNKLYSESTPFVIEEDADE